jgi:DNA-binding transcriptional LysR family regulator
MDLLQLEHFLAVVEERSFTRASERVGRTQPAISQSIKKLEEEIGAALFARDTTDLALTAAGEILAGHARKMLRTRDVARRDIRALRSLNAGMVNIAAHESAAVYLLPAPLREYATRFPGVKIGIHRSPLDDIPHQVMDREVHVGFVKETPAFHELKSIDVHVDEMVLVASPRHPLTKRRGVRVRDLGHERFVLHHVCSATEQKILRLFDDHHTPCHIAAELWSFENIKTFVQADVGMAIVPRITVRQELRDRTLVAIPVAELRMPRRTVMLYRDRGPFADSALELIKTVQTFNWTIAGVGERRAGRRPRVARQA